MDRSFLSSDELISVSRNFVCIRTATYEDKGEAEFLKRTFRRMASDLRNFAFCILSPDGKKKLRQSDRGPNYVYADSKEMAADLRKIASDYSGTAKLKAATASVPQMKSVRLGINVASCDGLPCVVTLGRSQSEVNGLNRKLSDVVWDEELAGTFIFASTARSEDLNVIAGTKPGSGFLVIKPGLYGTQGELIVAIDSNVSRDDLKKALVSAAGDFTRKAKTHGSHVRNGQREGVTWKTEVPVPERTRTSNRRRR